MEEPSGQETETEALPSSVESSSAAAEESPSGDDGAGTGGATGDGATGDGAGTSGTTAEGERERERKKETELWSSLVGTIHLHAITITPLCYMRVPEREKTQSLYYNKLPGSL